MKTELVNLEKMQLQPAALFQPGGLEELLARIESEARALVPDVSTGLGRKAIASNAARIPRSKTYLDDLGKNLTADLKKQTKAVDVERKNMRDRLDALKTEIRAPLTEWENAEKARVAGIEARLDRMRALSDEGDEDPYPVAELKANLETLKGIVIDDTFAEFTATAAVVKDAGVISLEKAIARREAEEAQQAELDQLHNEAAERERLERENQIRQEAAAKAKQEAEQAASAEANRLESEKRAAEQRAYEAENEARSKADRAVQRERERIESEREEKEASARQRAADMANRKRVEDAAVNAMMTFGLSDEQARTVVVAVRLGQIPNVSITY